MSEITLSSNERQAHIVCPACNLAGMKLIPQEWDAKGVITAFYGGFYFCTECASRQYVPEDTPKRYA